MKRREFIAGLSAATVAVGMPFGARAQQAMPVIGFLNSASPVPFAHLVAGFRRGLSEAGFVEGQNIAIEYRWAEGHYDRLPALVAELIGRHVTGSCGDRWSSLSPWRQSAASETDSHCFRWGRRSRKSWLGCKSQSSRRQCHWI